MAIRVLGPITVLLQVGMDLGRYFGAMYQQYSFGSVAKNPFLYEGEAGIISNPSLFNKVHED